MVAAWVLQKILPTESLFLFLSYIYIYGSLSFCLSFWFLLIRFHILLLTDNITTSLVPRQQTCKNTDHVPVGILAFRVVDVTFSFKGFFVSLHIYIAAGDTVIHRWCNFSPILPPSSLSAMATYPPTCSNTNTSQGMNMANSIANLRLKAKEYSLNQVPTVNWNTERLGDPRGREGALSTTRPPRPREGHCLWDEHYSTYSGSRSILFFLEQPWWYTTINVPMCKSAKACDGRIFPKPSFLFLLSITEFLFTQKDI